MKQLAILLLVLSGCERVVVDEYPQANLPKAARQENWRGPNGNGSCVYATTVSLLRWQGQDNAAERIQQYGGGADYATLEKVLQRENIKYRSCDDGDESFLVWACQTRRGCGVVIDEGQHFVALVGMTDRYVQVLDNNSVEHFIWIPRAAFLKQWRNAGGWAFTVMYSPVPPVATRIDRSL
jgi:hypothetical protein